MFRTNVGINQDSAWALCVCVCVGKWGAMEDQKLLAHPISLPPSP